MLRRITISATHGSAIAHTRLLSSVRRGGVAPRMFNRITISATHGRARSQPLCSQATHAGTMVALDCAYGFPGEQRPRRRQVSGLTSQINNFYETFSSHQHKAPFELLLCGKQAQLVRPGLTPNLLLEAHIKFHASSVFTLDLGRPLLYLSPDAPEEIDTSGLPPNDVVLCVGAIIDYNVKVGKSMKQAARHNVRTARLPLGGRSHPMRLDVLNVDTVLELLLEWSESGCYAHARDHAFALHSKRHPNRRRGPQ